MLLETSRFILDLWLAFQTYNRVLQLLFILLLTSTVTLLSWRLWRFTITPLLYPEEPREVPYWTPFIGHALAFLKNQDKVLSYGREYFNNTREPFAITLGREKLYILTSYHDVVAVSKNETTLDYGKIIQDLMRSFGVSERGVDTVYARSPRFTGEIHQRNPHNKSLFHLKSDFYHTQLHPGQRCNVIQEKILGLISNAMTFESLTKANLLSSSVDTKEASLYHLCQSIFVKAGLRAFFGENILQVSPSLLHDFIDFDNLNWMVFYNWTGPNVQAMRKPKAKVLAVLEEWLKLPKAQRPGAAWLIEIMEESQRQLGMDESDIAVVLMMLMWVVNTNAYRVSFWMLAYILHSPSLRSTIEAETAPSLGHEGAPVDVSYLAAKCPHLDSLWFEVLRLTNASSAMRTVLEPTRIGTKLLKPSNKVMSAFRQLHFDQTVFGKGLDDCDPDRFFRDKDLSRHPSYKPFGGGATMCPGRFIARQETYVFIALFLHRFEPKLAPGSDAFPKFELETPTTGIVSPRIGDDVVVTMKKGDVAA